MMMQNLSKQDLLTFWSTVIDPKSIGMPQAIAGEISSFTKEPRETVLSKMTTGEHDLKKLWDQISPNVSDPLSVANFYREQFTECYELANWHCGGQGEPPLNYAYAAKFANENNLNRVLDFGSGIGSGSLCFATVGCDVHAADIAQNLLNFVRYRLLSRGHEISTIDLNRTRPAAGYYDLVTCFDVLEHVPDQLSKLWELSSYLRSGGYLLVNLLEDSSDPDRPMHISSAGNIISLIRQTDLVPVWTQRPVDLQMLIRKPLGRIWNRAASWKDWLQGM